MIILTINHFRSLLRIIVCYIWRKWQQMMSCQTSDQIIIINKISQNSTRSSVKLHRRTYNWSSTFAILPRLLQYLYWFRQYTQIPFQIWKAFCRKRKTNVIRERIARNFDNFHSWEKPRKELARENTDLHFLTDSILWRQEKSSTYIRYDQIIFKHICHLLFYDSQILRHVTCPPRIEYKCSRRCGGRNFGIWFFG